MENADLSKQRRINPVPAIVTVALLLVGLATYCQTSHAKWARGHDRYRVLPILQWRVGYGFWDGINIKTHRSTSGRLYYYGVVERRTNAQ